MVRMEKAILAGLIISFAFVMCGFSAQRDDISDRILRLHVIANSDSESDQALKLKVRDRILEEGATYFTEDGSKAQAQDDVRAHMDELTNAARDEIRKQGYDYPVALSMEKTRFGTREYSSVTLPAGEYDALKVVIGSGKGKNWWCVMFPPMCLPAAEEKGELGSVLTEGEMDTVEGEKKYEIRFKALEIYEEFVDWVHGN